MYRKKVVMLFIILVMLPLIQNCGIGGGATKSDVIIADQLINEGWSNIKVGNYATAQTCFMQALSQPLTESQRISANTGMGWVLAKQGKINESIPFFEVAATAPNPDKDAKVGLAAALIWRHQTTEDYKRAAEILGNLPPESYTPTKPELAISAAKVHALAALAYALSGDKAMAEKYINKAAALDSIMVGTTVDKIDEAFMLLGWKK